MINIVVMVKGRLTDRWSGWFEGLSISYASNDETMLCGTVADQAALYGIISHLRDLGLPLISVNSKQIAEDKNERNC